MERRNAFVKDLAEIDGKGAQVKHTIPLDVLDAIDKGRNPEQSTFNILYVALHCFLSSVRVVHANSD